MKLRKLHEALDDLYHAAAYYESRSVGLGDAFLDATESLFDRLKRHPRMGPPVSDRVRRCIVPGFPYQVCYVIRDAEVLIIAIAHQRRRPNFWRGRLPD